MALHVSNKQQQRLNCVTNKDVMMLFALGCNGETTLGSINSVSLNFKNLRSGLISLQCQQKERKCECKNER